MADPHWPPWVYATLFVGAVFVLPFAFARYHDWRQRRHDERELAARSSVCENEER